MSLKKNILANYISQIYSTLIGIVMVPLYIRYMGAEAYGLVGFFAMLQAWFNLLEIGLTPTLARETARFRGGAMDALAFRRLVRTLEGIFLFVAIAGGAALLLLSDQIATNWLTAKQLPIDEVKRSMQLMAITISLRWMSGVYHSHISGAERLVWLSVLNIILSTLRFVGVILVLKYVSATPTFFFSYQLFLAIIGFLCFIIYSYKLLPGIQDGEKVAWSWAPLKPVLKFSLSIAFTSSMWVMTTQTDKLVLSKILPLVEYGYYTLAVVVASCIMTISGPISGALMPRMAKLEAEGDHDGLIRVYRKSTQLVAVIAGAAAVTVSFCSETILMAWTGDKVLTQQAAPVLLLYAIGNGILAVSAFPFYLQYAKGNLRLHLIGDVLFIIFLLPAIIWSASQYGGIGAGYTWLIVNAVYFVIWIPLVHNKFEPGLNVKWYFQDIFVIFFAAAMAGYMVNSFYPQSSGRQMQLLQVAVTGIFVLLAAFAASSDSRAGVNNWLALRKQRQET